MATTTMGSVFEFIAGEYADAIGQDNDSLMRETYGGLLGQSLRSDIQNLLGISSSPPPATTEAPDPEKLLFTTSLKPSVVEETAATLKSRKPVTRRKRVRKIADDESSPPPPPPAPVVVVAGDGNATFALVPLTMDHAAETERLRIIAAAFEPLGTDPSKWISTDGVAPKTGKKFTRNVYTPLFTSWVGEAARIIVDAGRKYGRMFHLTLDANRTICIRGPDAQRSPLVPNAGVLKIPGDARCTGCRRFYLSDSSVPDANKLPAFHACSCTPRAFYCVRCRLTQWASIIHENGATASVTAKVPCGVHGCSVMWGIADLMFLESTEEAAVAARKADTAAKKEKKRLKAEAAAAAATLAGINNASSEEKTVQ